MQSIVAVRVESKNIGKTRRSKPNTGSPFKNWNISVTSGEISMMLHGSRSIWDDLRPDSWYDMTIEKSRANGLKSSDWIISAEPNGYRKKLVIIESHGLPIDLGVIILEYSFPTKVQPKLVRYSKSLGQMVRI